MEVRVGSIVTPAAMMLDLGLMHDDMTKYEGGLWFSELVDNTIGNHCGNARQPPPTPESFDAMMDEKAEDGSFKVCFSNEADRPLIKGLFRTTHARVIGRAVVLNLAGFGWEMELKDLMPTLLPAAATLKTLNLSTNKLRGAPRVAYASVAPAEPNG